jgi:hypothetical protein
MSLTQEDVLAALHDAMLDAVKTRATVSAINELSESPAAAEKQFEAGLTELKDAYAQFSEVVKRVFPS